MPEAYLINFLFVSGKVIVSHSKLGHPMLYSYSDKNLCSCPPRVDFSLLLTCQLAKTNIEGTTTVPTNVMSIVACTTDETIKPLVKSVCDTVSENLVLGSHQDLGMHHNCSVKKATTYYWIAHHVERKFEAHFIESVRGTELRPWHCLTDVTSQG